MSGFGRIEGVRMRMLIALAIALPCSTFTAVAASAQSNQANPQPATPAARPTVAGDYSDAYEVRRKIHVYSSLATLPLFATQFVIGDKLYNNGTSSGMRTVHTV